MKNEWGGLLHGTLQNNRPRNGHPMYVCYSAVPFLVWPS
mgnify:FL=1